jgi:toxin ParE1/3/4
MPKLLFSARSRQDLAEIWDYIASDSVRQADAVHERIFQRCEKLIDQPQFGHRRDDVKSGLRCLNTDGYAIFYRIAPHHVGISRIVHHSRKLSALTFDES